jgi:hypothetical protein
MELNIQQFGVVRRASSTGLAHFELASREEQDVRERR